VQKRIKRKIKLSDILPPSIAEQFRVNGTDQKHINRLAAHMSKHGQLKGIEVKRDGKNRYKIVTGNHRFFAALQLGWTEIDAYIVSFAGVKEEEDRQFEEQEEHVPNKGNTKDELIKYIRRNLYVHKTFGTNPSLADLDKVVLYVRTKTSSFAPQTIRAVAKKLLEEAPAPSHSRGTMAYIKATKQLVNAIKVAMDGGWDGNSVKSSSKGWIVQCISQDSDATIKPGTSLVQKFNTGAKSCGVCYVGTIDGMSDDKIDECRIRWVERVVGFGKHIQEESSNRLKPFDKIVILPQKDSEIRSGVRRLELKKGKLVKFY